MAVKKEIKETSQTLFGVVNSGEEFLVKEKILKC